MSVSIKGACQVTQRSGISNTSVGSSVIVVIYEFLLQILRCREAVFVVPYSLHFLQHLIPFLVSASALTRVVIMRFMS